MTIPGVTPFSGQLPVEGEPASFPARAEALFDWLTGNAAPEIDAVAEGINEALNDNGTVLDATALAVRLTTNANALVTTGGTGNAFTITPAAAVPAYANGQTYMLRPNRANTGAVTLNVGGLGVVAVRKPNAAGTGFVELVANDWQTGDVHIVTYQGSQFELLTIPLQSFVRNDSNQTITAAWTFSATATFGTLIGGPATFTSLLLSTDNPVFYLQDTVGSADARRRTYFQRNGDVFAIGTANSGGAGISTDYLAGIGAAGAVSHQWNIGGAQWMQLATVAGVPTVTLCPTSGINKVRPGNNTCFLGASGVERWLEIYSQTPLNVSSDERLKEDFADYTETDLAAARLFKPQTFRIKATGRPSSGYIAQQIISAFEEAGLPHAIAAQRPVDLGLMTRGEDGMWGVHYELVNTLRLAALIG